MKYKSGVDFVLVAYGEFEYARLCVASIEKYWQGIEFTIYIVVNYCDVTEITIVKELFKGNDNVIVLSGLDQSKTIKYSKEGGITQELGTNAPGHPIGVKNGKVDGCQIAAGSWYGAWATNIGINSGDGYYVCVLDHDVVFLDSYAQKLLDLLSSFKFVSNRWCPANVFNHIKSNKESDGMARPMLMLSERSYYDDISDQQYVENDIWTSSPWNCDFRDMGGQMTWHAKQFNHKFVVLKNSYHDRFRPDNGLSTKHLLNITDGYAEQAWLDDTPIFFHHGRSGYRRKDSINIWTEEVEKYLDK